MLWMLLAQREQFKAYSLKVGTSSEFVRAMLLELGHFLTGLQSCGLLPKHLRNHRSQWHLLPAQPVLKSLGVKLWCQHLLHQCFGSWLPGVQKVMATCQLQPSQGARHHLFWWSPFADSHHILFQFEPWVKVAGQNGLSPLSQFLHPATGLTKRLWISFCLNLADPWPTFFATLTPIVMASFGKKNSTVVFCVWVCQSSHASGLHSFSHPWILPTEAWSHWGISPSAFPELQYHNVARLNDLEVPMELILQMFAALLEAWKLGPRCVQDVRYLHHCLLHVHNGPLSSLLMSAPITTEMRACFSMFQLQCERHRLMNGSDQCSLWASTSEA